MKAKETLLLNNTITQNPILARKPGFGMLHNKLLKPIIFVKYFYTVTANHIKHQNCTNVVTVIVH